jgi:hemerythrin-like domain-containing protein
MGTKASEHPGPDAFFTADHRECDRLWGELESLCREGDAKAARDAWTSFDRAMRRHFAMEEEVLFPAVEAAAGLMPHAGPTAVMRSEHEQMRGLLGQMEAAASSDLDELLDLGDTLLMLIQQHNTKEEGILYPMAGRALQADWDRLAEKLDRY